MVDGYIEPLQRQIIALTQRVEALENLSKPEDRTAAAAKVAEAKAGHLKKNPGQTLHPNRMPIVPGLPIAPYDPDTQGVDDATEAVIATEAKARDYRLKTGTPMTITEGAPALGSPADQIKAKRDQIAALEDNMELTPAARAVQIGRLNREINDLQAPSPPAA